MVGNRNHSAYGCGTLHARISGAIVVHKLEEPGEKEALQKTIFMRTALNIAANTRRFRVWKIQSQLFSISRRPKTEIGSQE